MTNPTKPGDPADRAADGAFGGVTSHRAGYGDKLARVEDWLRRHPTATLASGEGAALLEEIDRLRKELAYQKRLMAVASAEHRRMAEDLDRVKTHRDDLRADIGWVRTLHIRHKQDCSECEPKCVECDVVYPCPTLRALDKENA